MRKCKKFRNAIFTVPEAGRDIQMFIVFNIDKAVEKK